ncbi:MULTISPECIES: FAD-dependent oxidoreductase [unclassified Olleya]|jgi:thioredoxin reductase|uniref:FAD-dependent oxidoreductase n=1 Tax=unclassified Olleya TaxID=2615019 RepID=UPI0011A17102|nr:FAD-dependent oxidoreductase [Olleya sp. Hel_I_94]TVZ48419.1 pyridine nucleotide-disulfide oxidoreductase [Olleya sp. Hel_I_94]|tara:strand:+ start:173284 stop:173889 length:606 start_codon:yes stop_codon:yes gene_type:complete
MDFDTIIIGAGAAGLSCALILGSGLKKPFAEGKKVALITHQKNSHLQNALFNNVLGLKPGTLGKDLLEEGILQLSQLYPEVIQIDKEKAEQVIETESGYSIVTNKKTYTTKRVVIAVGYTNLLTISGLENYVKPHPKAAIEKDRIWLENIDHLIKHNLYVAGTLAGWRSQFAIASGSGAHVGTDILTLWNNGKHTKVHDKI